MVNSDGTGLAQLTHNTASDSSPSICDDGSKIAFSSNVNGDYEIFVVNSDGSGLTQLTSNTAVDFAPSISGDGSKIAYLYQVTYPYGLPYPWYSEIFLINLGWDVSLSASLGMYYDVSIFGVNDAATDSFDTTYDELEPPGSPSGVFSCLYYPDYPMSPVDMRHLSKSIIPSSDVMSWTYQVRLIDSSGSLDISWDFLDIAEILSEKNVYLFCPDGSIINMRNNNMYSFSAESGETYTFQIIVGGSKLEFSFRSRLEHGQLSLCH